MSGEKSERLTLRNRIVEMSRGGKNTAQIAGALGLPEGVVKGHLRQAGVLAERVEGQAPPPKPASEPAATSPAPALSAQTSPRLAHKRTAPKGVKTEAVLGLVAHGLSKREIARRLSVSDTTVEYHIRKAQAQAQAAERPIAMSAPAAPDADAQAIVRLSLPAPAALVGEVLRAVAGAMPGARVEVRAGELVVVECRDAETGEREARAA